MNDEVEKPVSKSSSVFPWWLFSSYCELFGDYFVHFRDCFGTLYELVEDIFAVWARARDVSVEYADRGPVLFDGVHMLHKLKRMTKRKPA